jgi:hypothetical protein
MTDPDFRALCAELIYELTRTANGLSNRTANDNHRALWAKDAYQAADRARAALAQPEPPELTDEDLYQFWESRPDLGLTCDEPVKFARAVLARYGTPAINPVPVSERLPGPEDCDAEGRCWVGCPAFVDDGDHGSIAYNPSWELCRCTPDDTHWLPHWALPTPANTIREESFDD